MKKTADSTLNVLVDYDNISARSKGRGSLYIVESILDTLDEVHLSGVVRLAFRFYGGWDQNGTLTRFGQNLTAELRREFPYCRTMEEKSNKVFLFVNAELATSLVLEPTLVLKDTYRPHHQARAVSCIDPTSVGCTLQPCGMIPIYHYFLSKVCSNSACSVGFHDLFRQPSQKMVDSMIFSDLVFLALQGNQRAVVVGSDDDLWPGIRLALEIGVRVHHVHTRPNRSTPAYLISSNEHHYSQTNLS